MDQGDPATGETEDIISQELQSEESSKGILYESKTSLIAASPGDFEDILK